MPKYWYSIRDNLVKAEDNDETKQMKDFNRKIAAANKPYFMTYVYPSLKTKNNTYNSNSDNGALMRFGEYGIHNFNDLYNYEPKTKEMINCLRLHKQMVGYNPCVVNKICWTFEKIFDKFLSKKQEDTKFDYTILKCNVGYSKKNYSDILNIYKDYQYKLRESQKKKHTEKVDGFDCIQQREMFVNKFKRDCEVICTNEYELCDIVLDICYKSEKTKQFAWDISGEVILENLLKNNGRMINYPRLTDGNGEFEYCGENFTMKHQTV